ncbi:hypothetical protein AB6A40_005946 [Gnathostoma spinigerum]|uniref:DUF7083 domain-containing protein n=1 Tax=Gnathostoma spinigerum TaxID=75299 RepID=A0ABD6ERQ6_9BILA
MSEANDASASHTADPLIMLLQQQQQQMQQQQQQMQQLRSMLAYMQQPRQPSSTDEKVSTATPVAISAVNPALENFITTFSYLPEDGITFAAWFKLYEDNFTVDAQKLDDAARVRFLLRKLDAAAHERYVNYILPRQTRDVNFNETVATLKDIFGPPHLDIQPTLPVSQTGQKRMR